MPRRRGRAENPCPPLIVWVFAILSLVHVIGG